MKRIAGLSLIVILALCISVSAQSAFTLDQVFARMDVVAKTFSSIESTIEQDLVTVIVNDHNESSGKFYYLRKGKTPRVKMERSKPAPEFVLIDNGKLQHYVPATNQLQEFSLAGRQDAVETFLAIGFGQSSDDIKKSFDVTPAPDETIDGRKVSVLDLKPKKPGNIRSVRMWMDQQRWVSVRIKVVQSSNDYVVINYKDIKLNGGIGDSRFKLDLPKNVRIVKG